jgi:hypothetical protein
MSGESDIECAGGACDDANGTLRHLDEQSASVVVVVDEGETRDIPRPVREDIRRSARTSANGTGSGAPSFSRLAVVRVHHGSHKSGGFTAHYM